jgi:hypothetical protein
MQAQPLSITCVQPLPFVHGDPRRTARSATGSARALISIVFETRSSLKDTVSPEVSLLLMMNVTFEL